MCFVLVELKSSMLGGVPCQHGMMRPQVAEMKEMAFSYGG
jgi:hypothetical protein